jgi:hypothetical protein
MKKPIKLPVFMFSLLAALGTLLPSMAFADEINGANTSWILTSTAL